MPAPITQINPVDPVSGTAPTAAQSAANSNPQADSPTAPNYNVGGSVGGKATRYPTETLSNGGTFDPNTNTTTPSTDPNLSQSQSQLADTYNTQLAGIRSAYASMLSQQTTAQTKVNTENTGQVRSGLASTGQLGTTAGGTGAVDSANQAGSDALAAIQDTLNSEEQNAEASVFGNEAAGFQSDETAKLNATLAASQKKVDAIVSGLPTLAGTTPLSKIDSATQQQILDATGWTPAEFYGIYNAYSIAASKPGTQILQGADGKSYMVSTNPQTGAIISTQDLGLPAGTVAVPQGGAIYDPNTNSIVAQGQSKPTSIPVAGTAAYDAPAAAGGKTALGAGTAPASGSNSQGSGGSTPIAPAVPGATSGGNATQGQGSASITDPTTGGPVSWGSLGISGAQVNQLTALGQSPQTVYMQAWAAITGAATDTSSTSGGGGGTGGAAIGKIMSGAVAKAQASIMKAYGLTPADLPAIAAIAGGTTTALEAAIPQQSTIHQYISKTSANLNTLQGAITNYNSGDSPLVNEALQALQANVTGDPKYAALNTALTPFLAEYAKVMQGSTGSVSGATVNSQQEAAGLLQASMNKGSFASSISVMLQDMAGQVNSKNAQILDLTQNLGDVVQQYSQDKGNKVNIPQNNPTQFSVGGNSYYVGDAVPVTDQSGNTILYQVEADGSLNPY